MKGAVLFAPHDVRYVEREDPTYRGIQRIDGPTPMGHEYVGIVEEVGKMELSSPRRSARHSIAEALQSRGNAFHAFHTARLSS